MNNHLKPDEAMLIAYCYGEIDDADRSMVEAYLAEHPEELRRLESWGFVRKAMSRLEDEEVIAPPIIVGQVDKPIWKERYFRMTLGIAASFLVVLIAARLMGLGVGYSSGELRIGFQLQEKPREENRLTQQQVDQMIKNSLAVNNEELQSSWSKERVALENSVRQNMDRSSEKIDRLMKTASLANEDEVKKYVGQMQRDNLKLMKDYLQLSSAGQKEYIESLLVDFSKYLQEQRKQDLELLQTRMASMEQNTDQIKQETEQILTSLISSNGTSNQLKKSN